MSVVVQKRFESERQLDRGLLVCFLPGILVLASWSIGGRESTTEPVMMPLLLRAAFQLVFSFASWGGLMFLAIPLVLGSTWTFAPVVAMTSLLMVRTVLEERVLHRDLAGYEEFMSATSVEDYSGDLVTCHLVVKMSTPAGQRRIGAQVLALARE